MNKLIISLIILGSCSNVGSKKRESTNRDQRSHLKNIEGVWIAYDYYEDLKRTYSPAKSLPFLKGVVYLIITNNHLTNDTIHADISLNDHEGGTFPIFLSSRDSSNKYKIDVSSFSSYKSGTIQIDSPFLLLNAQEGSYRKYIKLSDSITGIDPIQYFTLRTLFKGKYLTNKAASIFDSNQIIFDENTAGVFKGSKIYDSLCIQTDFVEQEEVVSDNIFLYNSKHPSSRPAYKIRAKGDSIILQTYDDSIPYVLTRP